MGDVSEAKEVFTELKRQILERVDLSRDVSDEEMQELIDEVVISYGKEQAVSLNERCRLKKELFHALRKMDVLQELLEEPDVTEIMVNGMNGIFLEKDGTLSRWEKNFYSGERILDVIRQINGDASVHGCLIFRPLPKRFDDRRVQEALAPEKDVDGITDGSMAGVFTNMPIGYPPCTAQACLEILKYYNVPLSGKRAVVVGRSLVVGKPAAMMLMGKNATDTVCHTKTVNTAEICRKADILVSAAGVLNSLTKDFVRPGQVVIDVSINWDANKPNAKGGLGGIAGDAKFDEVEPIVDAITPVPGGVGSVTTSVLMKHVVEAAEKL